MSKFNHPLRRTRQSRLTNTWLLVLDKASWVRRQQWDKRIASETWVWFRHSFLLLISHTYVVGHDCKYFVCLDLICWAYASLSFLILSQQLLFPLAYLCISIMMTLCIECLGGNQYAPELAWLWSMAEKVASFLRGTYSLIILSLVSREFI